MIIRSLRVEAFMRYELLELVDLPTGVIAVTGENEAGKSTIGEAIAFALFGRSVRTENTDPAQAIHWEHDACTTRIEVEIKSAGLHRVERRVGRRGEFEAALYGPGDELLAEGPLAVSQRLTRLLGFDFPIFRYSFYVAQHELDLLQRESQDNARKVVSDMLGISTLDRAAEHLRGELVEMRERGQTLDRDQAVAKALYTEMLPVREELDTIAERVAEAQSGHEAAQVQAAQAQRAAELARQAVEAGGARVRALQQLGVALAARVHARRLLAGRAQLEALATRLGQRAAGVDEQAQQQAQAVSQRAETLTALVQARATSLQQELEGDDPDALPSRLGTQQAAIDLAVAQQLRWTLLTVFLTALSLGTLGAAAATQLPQGQPALTFPERLLQSPRLGVQWTLTPEGLTLPLAVLGCLGLVLTLVGFLARGKAKRQRDDGVSERGRLDEVKRQLGAELDACRAFQLGSLAQVAPALAKVTDQGVQEALSQLQAAAGKLMDSAQSPKQLLAEASDRGRAAQLAAQARKTLAAVEGAIASLFPQGAPAAPEAATPPEALDAAADLLESVTGAVTKARVELEALSADGPPPSVEASVQAAQAAFDEAFQALGDDEPAARSGYTEKSGLSELLTPRDPIPAVEDMRAVLERERKLGLEVFGTSDALAAGLREAEGRLQAASTGLLAARSELDDATARAEKLSVSERRLEELEARIGDLAEVLEPMQRQVEVHAEAIELFEDLADALRARFGPGIERYVELVLPRLTQGRYRRVQVGDDLDIRIFSPERGDFVRLIELSLGTADQVLLALRLGLARALIGSRGISGGHFLFLDEPLVSADPQREQAFLELLRTFDEEFTQIFVSSPRALENDLFVRKIELTREAKTHRLEAGASA